MKRILAALLLILFTLPLHAENTILIVGDSISAGLGIDPKQGWVTLLAQRLKSSNYPYQVVNASISGDTTQNGLDRLPKALSQYHPQITVIELGGNDGLRGLQIVSIQKNLQQMITLAKQAKSQVILLGVRLPPNYGSVYGDQFQQMFTTLAHKNAIIVVPLFLNGIDDQPDKMQADGIHPAQNAQAQLVDNMWLALKSMLSAFVHR